MESCRQQGTVVSPEVGAQVASLCEVTVGWTVREVIAHVAMDRITQNSAARTQGALVQLGCKWAYVCVCVCVD